MITIVNTKKFFFLVDIIYLYNMVVVLCKRNVTFLYTIFKDIIYLSISSSCGIYVYNRIVVEGRPMFECIKMNEKKEEIFFVLFFKNHIISKGHLYHVDDNVKQHHYSHTHIRRNIVYNKKNSFAPPNITCIYHHQIVVFFLVDDVDDNYNFFLSIFLFITYVLDRRFYFLFFYCHQI